jgi:hypothetical protein
MTVYEHAMLGINGALAAGLAPRYGWPIVAMAGAAAVLPDLDGLTILFGIFPEGIRLPPCALGRCRRNIDLRRIDVCHVVLAEMDAADRRRQHCRGGCVCRCTRSLFPLKLSLSLSYRLVF